MPSHCDGNPKTKPVRVFDCGCFVGEDGGTYCCARHFDLVGLLHTQKKAHDPVWKCPVEPD